MTKIRVKNYQAARDVTLDISGLTVLKGNSNAGKSSVLKAIYSATHNRFRRGCVTWNEDSCVVLIQYEGESKVLRVERSALGASPRVRLGSKKEGYLQFSKMNRDLPQEVQSYNKFGYVQITPQEKLSLNFSTQFSPPLMVKFSNKRIVEILSYSKATQEAQKAKKWIDERASFLRGQFSALDSALASTKHQLGELQKQLRLFKDSERIQNLSSSVSALEEKLEKLQALKSLISLNKAIKKRGSLSVGIKKLLIKSKTSGETLSDVLSLSNLYNRRKLLRQQAVKVDEIIKCLHKVSDNQLRALEVKHLFKENLLLRKRSELSAEVVSVLTELESLEAQQVGHLELSVLLRQSARLQRRVIVFMPLIKVLRTGLHLQNRSGKLNSLLKCLSVLALVKRDLQRSEQALLHAECPLCGTRIS